MCDIGYNNLKLSYFAHLKLGHFVSDMMMKIHRLFLFMKAYTAQIRLNKMISICFSLIVCVYICLCDHLLVIYFVCVIKCGKASMALLF